MISTARVRVISSPSSLCASNRSSSTRSSPACSTEASRAPHSFLRSSMQSMGGCAGFSTGYSVKWMRAELAEAESSSLRFWFLPRIAKISISRAG